MKLFYGLDELELAKADAAEESLDSHGAMYVMRVIVTKGRVEEERYIITERRDERPIAGFRYGKEIVV